VWLLYILVFCLYLGYLAVCGPAAAAVAFAGYAICVPGAYLASMRTVLAARPPELPAPRRPPRPPADGDPAVLQYFYGPALADTDHVLRLALASCRKLWEFGVGTVAQSFDTDDAVWLTGPLGVGGAIGMGLGTVAGALVAVVLALAYLLVVVVCAAFVRTAGALLRGADSVLLAVKNITMVCPHCYQRVPYPAYDCPGPGCTRRHRDVRPGRYGVLRRRCRCGAPLHTLLLLGSSRMAAFCPHPGCEGSLEHRPGEVPEIVLPLFGATGAGKTRLLFAMVTQLRSWTEQGQLEAGFGDSATTRELAVAEGLIRSGGSTTGTSIELPRAHVIRLKLKQGVRILQLYDAAGERFYHTDRTQELRYLSQARTFILVIDPLSVPGFWQQLPADTQAALSSVRSAAPSPELAYQQTHQEIEAMGVRLAKVRLAVVFSRADLIDVPDGEVSQNEVSQNEVSQNEVSQWARRELGLGNLVRSAAANFKETGYFRTAAVAGPDGLMHPSVAQLMRWVMSREGVELP
jgi:Double-GTPase 2